MVTVSGGDAFNRAMDELAAKLDKKGTLKVGFLEGAKYPDGTSVAMVAAVQNFGSAARGIPPRPFFSNMVTAKSPTWAAALANLLEANGNDAMAALALMGEGVKGQLQQSIRDTNAPPLSPRTVKRKGFSKPLIDTSHMINSVDYEVSE